MKARASNFWEWQKHFSGEQACIKEIIQTRWPDGYQCQIGRTTQEQLPRGIKQCSFASFLFSIFKERNQ